MSRELIVCILLFLDPVIICESYIVLIQQILHGEMTWIDPDPNDLDTTWVDLEWHWRSLRIMMVPLMMAAMGRSVGDAHGIAQDGADGAATSPVPT